MYYSIKIIEDKNQAGKKNSYLKIPTCISKKKNKPFVLGGLSQEKND